MKTRHELELYVQQLAAQFDGATACPEQYIELALGYAYCLDTDNAVVLADEATAKFPESPEVSFWSGYLYEMFDGRADNLQRARLMYEKATRIPGQWRPLALLRLISLSLEYNGLDLDEAGHQLEQLLVEDPSVVQACLLLARIHLIKGNRYLADSIMSAGLEQVKDANAHASLMEEERDRVIAKRWGRREELYQQFMKGSPHIYRRHS